jgi:hypothetical protein
MVRWVLLFVLPILICTLAFQAFLVFAENLRVNFITGERPAFGAPFLVGAGTGIHRGDEVTPTFLERFSFFWFAIDVFLTAAIAVVIAWFLRIRNVWVPSLGATAVAGLLLLTASSTPPVPVWSFGFAFWIYWIVAFAVASAIWTGVELNRARPRRG